jgi:hypothetical protein
MDPMNRLIWPLLAALAGFTVSLASIDGLSRVTVATTVGMAVQIILLAMLKRINGRALAATYGFGLSWLVYFGIRLMVIEVNRGDINELAAVRAASDFMLVWLWALTTIGLAFYVLGVWLAAPRQRTGISRRLPELSTRMLLSLAVFGVLFSYLLAFGHLSTGIGTNIASLDLFAFAALGRRSAGNRPLQVELILFVAASSLLGLLTSFKEAAILPVAAAAVGWASSWQVSKVKLTSIGVACLMLYIGGQSMRVADSLGQHLPLWQAPFAAFTKYNLAAGVAATPGRSSSTATVQVGESISRRLGGVASLVALRDKVPNDVPYQHGRTIWQTSMSALPVLKHAFPLTYDQLSLGKWFNANLISADPQNDPSSQAITVPGDLYLNFGSIGVGIGMLVIGFLSGRLERLMTPDKSSGVGLLLFIGYPLLGLERNLGYSIITVAIRLVVGVALLGLVRSSGVRRKSPAETVFVPRSLAWR